MITLPAAALLRRALPEARIAWAVERRASAILEDSPAIDELNVMPVDWSKISADEIRKGKAEWQSIFSP